MQHKILLSKTIYIGNFIDNYYLFLIIKKLTGKVKYSDVFQPETKKILEVDRILVSDTLSGSLR